MYNDYNQALFNVRIYYQCENVIWDKKVESIIGTCVSV